jgi:hypothetical protein
MYSGQLRCSQRASSGIWRPRYIKQTPACLLVSSYALNRPHRPHRAMTKGYPTQVVTLKWGQVLIRRFVDLSLSVSEAAHLPLGEGLCNTLGVVGRSLTTPHIRCRGCDAHSGGVRWIVWKTKQKRRNQRCRLLKVYR